MKKRVSSFDIAVTVLVLIITVIIAYPLYFCIIASFSDIHAVVRGETLLWIKDFTTEAYEYVFKEKELWIGYRNTIFYTLFGTIYNLVLTLPVSYAMTKKNMPFRNALSWYFFITMYLSGGMIPTYMLYKNLGLINNPLALILGIGVNCYNMIVARQYFSSTIPEDLYDAAYIDGASEFKVFTQIALPLAKPIIAVLVLYYAVGHWNSYYNALLYIHDKALHPLQLVLRSILINNSMTLDLSATMDAEAVAYMLHRQDVAEAMKYAIVIIASAPLLALYPFLQKYFTKGIMIGSVKG